MLGVMVNAVAILVGGVTGAFIKNKLSKKYKTIIMQALGIAILFVGIVNAVSGMILPESNSILFILSLVIGSIIGTALGIDDKLNKFGGYIEKKFSKTDSSFSKAFISTTILFCVGTLAVLGSIESGIQGTHNLLFVKAILDCILAVIIAATSGIGVAFSALSVFIYEGILTLSAKFFSEYCSDDMIREISIVGGIIVAAIGLDLLGIKKMKIANFLPAVFIPILYYIVKDFVLHN